MTAAAFAIGVVLLAASVPVADPAARVRADRQQQQPLVAHVVVALCDNVHQGIVPVPPALGNGRDPAHNLYWGARFGVRTYLGRAAGWTRVPHTGALPDGVLERVAFRTTIGATRLYVVADAWDGARMPEAISAFLELASGRRPEAVELEGLSVQAGGSAHVVAFVGHNGLMDFPAPAFAPGSTTPARAAMVLACASKPYFARLLERAGAHPLLLTTGLMAPEAYSLEAALREWFGSTDPGAVRRAAADAYAKHQGCGRRAAWRLFAAE